MNRFLTRKKTKDSPDESPTSSSFGFAKGKKGKKQPEPEPNLDLSSALPSSDEFRTSLIMPNLSARFSMLREQDDPKSKLGKASDDSVLQPKRQSRLNDYGFKTSALADIDEVSINGSIRPPFATRERQGSFDTFRTDLEESENGSIMSRARPGEGNVLFGGRQKVYRIGGNVKGMGKALYEDDVGLSTFQRLRREEKEQERREAEAAAGALDASTIAARRETSSSTNSGPSNTRSSTAANSIASQGANSISASSPSIGPNRSPVESTSNSSFDKSTTKSRRLYEQGLEQHIHDQQMSTMSRLNTVHKHRGNTANDRSSPQLAQAKSASNLGDRYNRPSHPFRTASPPPVASYTNFAALYGSREAKSSTNSPKQPQSQSPVMSPVNSEYDELTSALRPGDRGKATALGAFNKPTAYDEQQYLQRQMQMHKGRETPPLKPEDSLRSIDQEHSRSDIERTSGTISSRVRSPSNQSSGSSPFSVFQNAANQMRSPTLNGPEPDSTQYYNTGGIQQPLQYRDQSEDEVESSYAARQPRDLNRSFASLRRPSPSPHLVAPPLSDHPALRSQKSDRGSTAADDISARTVQSQPSVSISATAPQVHIEESKDMAIDSPTLPEGGGLSGLVRQHLRNVSNVSSVYTDGADSINESMPANRRSTEHGYGRSQINSEVDTTVYSAHSNSNPWDLEDVDRAFYDENESRSSASNSLNAPTKSSGVPIARTNSEREARAYKIQHEAEARRAAWESEMMAKHSRQPSAEERDAFQQELQLRQKAIIARMQEVQAEEDSHSFSRKAFGMLRTKSSRDSMASGNKTETSHKPFRNFGFGNSTTSLNQTGNRNESGKSSEDFGSRSRSRSQSRHRQAPLKLNNDANYQERQQLMAAGHEGRDDNRPAQGRSPPGSSKSSTRDRSSSDISGRSRSRPPRHAPAYDGNFNESSVLPHPPMPSAHSAEQHRDRSNSNLNMELDSTPKTLSPLHVPTPNTGRFSPGAPSPSGYAPMFPPSPRPSPGPQSPEAFMPRQGYTQANFSAHSTPPISAANTPTTANFGQNTMVNRPPIRRKTINKQDISEPVLVSSTSVQDTVDLPPGASLKNGLISSPPPLPTMNPKRRFGFGRSQPQSPVDYSPSNESQPPFLQHRQASGEDPTTTHYQRERMRKTSDAYDRPAMSGPMASRSPRF